MAMNLRDVTNMQENILSQICQTAQVMSNNDSGCDFGCDAMDDSLTDMQWLQKMDASAEIPGMKRGGLSRKRRAGSENKAVAKESCRKKLDYPSVKKGTSNKPPLSYASLIALAICSTPQRMLTLSGIYKWIENTFPFYRTPEAKAWKNSIRHNLSIRKGMFMKVYQYPPRRGNGSYWTLLGDGEDELKRAIPLFSTFQPPVIDPESVYNRAPATHTVKSRGQFIPVLPRSDREAGSQPYFSVGSSVMSTDAGQAQHQEVVILQSSEDVGCKVGRKRKLRNEVFKPPAHLLDHSYAKQLPQLLHSEDSAECSDSSTDSESTIEAPLTPKRKKTTETRVTKRSNLSRPHAPSQENLGVMSTSFTLTTPSRDHDISLSFLDKSLLTPLKDIVNDIEIGGPQGISLSPLYANFVSPHCDTPRRPTTTNVLPSPLTPLRNSNTDSGIFTPFQPSDSLDRMKCSTPLRLFSPISNILPPHGFSTPHQDLFPSLKILDNSSDSPVSSIRLGSLQALGLPGLTPPSTNLR